MTSMNLSVVINTYNRPQTLGHCLEALARNGGEASFEVIVVDDGGTCDLAPIECAWRDRLDLKILHIAHAGRSAARNRGVAVAQAERIVFLGDDVSIEPGCLERHGSYRDPLQAVVGPYPWRSIVGSPPLRRWAEPNPQRGIDDPQNAGFQYFATGNLSLVRARFLDLGGFDERFQCYGWEDIDLGLRHERAGGRLIFDAQARAVHDHPFLPRSGLWRREYEMGITAWQFWDKWHHDVPEVGPFMKFWDDAAMVRPGPAWRRWLGDWAIALLDRIAPASELNKSLYERMVFAYRLAGVAEGWRRGQRKDEL